jgi:hypothetical protein
MGILVINTPAASVTSTVPVAKDVQAKVFQVARSETSSVVKLILPADATILSVVREGSTASDAATTATVTITVANNGGTVSSKADDVKGSGATTGFVTMSSLPNAEPRPLNGDLTVSAIYAETGTASTTGGPWNYVVNYVR